MADFSAKSEETLHQSNILVADDSVNDLRLLTEILAGIGYAVRPSIDGEAALASIRAETPDLILLDVRMPKMDGFDVCRQLKSDAVLSAIPVIFLSASERIEDKVKAFTAGAVDYITKPYQTDEILARVRTHLSLNAMKKELEKSNVSMAREISERKKIADQLVIAKEKAEAASRAKTEFLANMSHELRTPLNHIIGFSEILAAKHYGDLNEAQEEYLNDILTSGRHLLSLISDILDISKVESGKMELELSDVDLKALLEDSLTVIKEEASKRQIKIIADIIDLPRFIRADERKLKQVLYNLLGNAVKFSSEGGKIHLAAEWVNDSQNTPCEKGVHVSVRDTGIGLKPEDTKRIFVAFEQVETSSTRKYSGTGLGLYLARQMVALHGGRLWAESTGEGRGSTFHFILPVQND